MQSGQDKAVRSRDDIAKAVSELTPADWIRLRRAAAFWALGRPIGAKDLLQEAFARAMDGRVCPADVGTLKFLSLTMRSIAHGEGEKVGNRLLLVSADPSDAVAQKVLDLPDPAASAEQQMLSQEAVTEIRSAILALFDDDEKAHIIAEGQMDGIDGEELRVLCELDIVRPNSKRQLVRRRIEKAFPERMAAMTGGKKEAQDALDRLAAALVDDVMSASDAEILAAFREDGGDPDQNATEMRALFERSVLASNKSKLQAARTGIAQAKAKATVTPSTCHLAGRVNCYTARSRGCHGQKQRLVRWPRARKMSYACRTSWACWKTCASSA